MFDGLAEKGFGRGYIALRTEHEVHSLAGRPDTPPGRDRPTCHESSDRSRQHATTVPLVLRSGSST
jgi:hypothetical protein